MFRNKKYKNIVQHNNTGETTGSRDLNNHLNTLWASNIIMQDKILDLDNNVERMTDIIKLENNTKYGENLTQYSMNYENHTIHAKNNINPQHYYQTVAREIKVRTKVLGFNGHPKYKTVYENIFNQGAYNNALSSEQGKINEAQRLEFIAKQETDRAQKNLEFAKQQISSKILEIEKQTQEINSSRELIKQQIATESREIEKHIQQINLSIEQEKQNLDNLYFRNAEIKEIINQKTIELNFLNAEKLKYENEIRILPQKISQTISQTSQQKEILSNLNFQSEKIFEQIQKKEQEQREFIRNKLTLTQRTELFIELFNNSNSLNKEAQLLIQEMLKSNELNYEYMMAVAIKTNNKKLLEYAINKINQEERDWEEVTFGNKNLIQIALQNNNEEIMDFALNNLKSSEYFSSFEISLHFIFKSNDYKSLEILLQKQGDSLIPAFEAILTNAAEMLELDMVNQIVELFPSMAYQILNKQQENLFTILLEALDETDRELAQYPIFQKLDIANNIKALFLKVVISENNTNWEKKQNTAKMKQISKALELFPEYRQSFELMLEELQVKNNVLNEEIIIANDDFDQNFLKQNFEENYEQNIIKLNTQAQEEKILIDSNNNIFNFKKPPEVRTRIFDEQFQLTDNHTLDIKENIGDNTELENN